MAFRVRRPRNPFGRKHRRRVKRGGVRAAQPGFASTQIQPARTVPFAMVHGLLPPAHTRSGLPAYFRSNPQQMALWQSLPAMRAQPWFAAYAAKHGFPIGPT